MAKLTDLEKQSPQYLEHRLEWRRMWWEKGLLALFIAVALFLGNYIIENFKTDFAIVVEDFKSDLTVSEFLLEERLKGLKAVRAAYSEVSSCMECCFPTPPEKCNDKKYDKLYEKYRREITNFYKVLNEWSMLYPDSFSKTLAGHARFHIAIADKHIVLTEDHFPFGFSVCQNFDYATRMALYESTLGQKGKIDTGIFEFHKESMDKLSTISSKEFFDINFDKHKKENSKE